jgi:hypothetical protein
MVGMKLLACAALAATSTFSQTSALADRVGSTGFLQLRAESFRTLEPRQKELAYWLVQASIAIDPIIYDQLSAYGIREKRLLEEYRRAPRGNRCRAPEKHYRFRQAVLGQPRQSQRKHLAEIPSGVYGRRFTESRGAGIPERRFPFPLRRSARARFPRRW